jgi:hypothetical protein
MIADANTGKQAWDMLAATYASTNMTNVMRLDEFGAARKNHNQTMAQWISYIKSLVAQLRGVGTIIPASLSLSSSHSTHKVRLRYDLSMTLT